MFAYRYTQVATTDITSGACFFAMIQDLADVWLFVDSRLLRIGSS